MELRRNTPKATHLRLDQDQVNEQYYQIVLHIFVREAFAARTLRQPYAFPEGAVIGFAIGCVERADGISAFDAYRHGCMRTRQGVVGGALVVAVRSSRRLKGLCEIGFGECPCSASTVLLRHTQLM